MSEQSIGFIGIGNMGWPMASNLIQSGHRITVYDIDQGRAGRFSSEHKDAIHAPTLGELGSAVDMVITMLPNGHIVRRVMVEEADGLVRSLASGTLLIDMSSSDPIGTRELGEILDEKGIQFVDAPVSGGVPGAQAATLAIMMGSDNEQALERARPVLSHLGKKLFETGPLGSGHAMKALNNFCAAMGFAAVSEAVIVGRRFGLDPSVMVDVLNASTGRNFTTEHTIVKEVIKREFASGFALDLLAKDVKIAADLAEGLRMNTPFTKLISEQFLAALDSLGAGRDFTETFLFWESCASKEK